MKQFQSILPSLLIILICSQIISAQNQLTNKFFRHLHYNHVSPHVSIKGIHEFEKKDAINTSHYLFKYNDKNQLVEIINNHYHTERMHPLTTFGAYRTVISYTKDTETRLYFDKNNQRITNDRAVYKEVYLFDKKGFKKQLNFFDLEDQPMESNWKIAKYEWSKHKKLVIEKRYNMDGEMVNISPYFEFGITGIKYNKKGIPEANYNLSESLEIQNNAIGVASYKDTYDAHGNHIRYSYYDKDNRLTMNQWRFAFGEKTYDQNGNQLFLSTFDTDHKLINKRKIPSNINVEMAGVTSREDSMSIIETSLGYLVALQELNPELMKKVMHEDLAKRTIGYDREKKKEIIRETTYQQMLDFAESWNKSGTKFPFNPNNEAIILDIYNRMATVKLISDNWVEYLHLVKTNREWHIVNLFWLHKDVNRYPKD